MTRLLRTDASNNDFIGLVRELDAELAVRDGEEHAFYSQYNKTSTLSHVVIVFENERACACGALKQFSPGVMEIKRMYTIPELRGKGIAAVVLKELESWAKELSCEKTILETGKRQPEAIKLYTKSGYNRILNYGQYQTVENSVCFEKTLS